MRINAGRSLNSGTALALVLSALLITAPQNSFAQAQPAAAPAAAAPAEQSAEVRIGRHADYTRIVFDMPRLTAYAAENKNGGIALSFETDYVLKIPRTASPLVKSVSSPSPNNFTIQLSEGATFKHYRLMRKIVVDIFPPKTAAQTPVAAPTEEKPPAAEVKTAEKAPEIPAVTPEIVAAEKTPVATAPEQKPEMPAVPAPEAQATPVETQATPVETPVAEVILPTTISLSPLEPVKVAVFSRFNILWIVVDSDATGAQMPAIAGPLAKDIGEGKTLKFAGGIAYRYTVPAHINASVKKKNLSWEISLAPAITLPPASSAVKVEYDNTSKQAKLIIPLQGAGKVLKLEDPLSGDSLYVMATAEPKDRVDQARRFANLDILPASAGLVVRPISDDIRVNRIQNFVLVSAPRGITATPSDVAGPALVVNTDAKVAPESRLFDFSSWRQGGLSRLNENRRILEGQIAEARLPEARHDLLMKLAFLYFANNFGQETLGVLRLIESDNPDITANTNFIALRGAANALAGHYDEALRDLSTPAIQQHPEVSLWLGYVAAATEQWNKASRLFPSDGQMLESYPQNLSVPFTIYMAESALRVGRTDTAKKLLSSIDTGIEEQETHYRAAISYLKGEVARQEGNKEEAIRIWTPVADGLDRLYHTKASIALANLSFNEKKITLKEAIDRVDSLRFAWRGDGLEVQTLHNLGLLKTQNGQYLEGMQDMRFATELAERTLNDPQPIKDDISKTFFTIFSVDQRDKVKPLEAVAVYNEFGSLIPPGDAGSESMLLAADYMIGIDLLGKAAKILEEQITNGYLAPEKVVPTGIKLAAIYLLDDKPENAIAAIDKTASAAINDKDREERELLRARAQSQLNQTDAAIQTLSPFFSKNALRLKADVLWRAKRWGDAAKAIESMLPPPNNKPLAPEEAEMALNAAVAHKLAGDPAALQALRASYAAGMAGTPTGSIFNVVTRTGGESSLSDRNTIMKIAGEVDMFKGFLDGYKSNKGS